eukprot:422341_1
MTSTPNPLPTATKPRRNQFPDHHSDDIKQTNEITKEQSTRPTRVYPNDDQIFTISDDLVANYFNNRNEPSQNCKKPFTDLAGPNIDKKQLDKIKGFETEFHIPIREYMWDTLDLLRINKCVDSQSTDAYLKCLPCTGGTFQHFHRFKTDYTQLMFSKSKPPNKQHQIKALLDCAKHEFRDTLSPIVLPDKIPFKIDGVWEMDVRIFRAINDNLDRLTSSKIMCQIHISVWSNGPMHQTKFKYPSKETKTDNDNDTKHEDPDTIQYEWEPTVNEEIININNKCCNINIEDIMLCNKAKNVIKKVSKPHTNETYEQIEVLINDIMEGAARPKNGDAIMILFDTSNVPELTAYIWRERLTENDHELWKGNDSIGDKRIKSKANRKRRYFELNAPQNDEDGDDTNRKVNVGQYVGMDIFLQASPEMHKVHQFWTIFNTETRFDPSHAAGLWRDYYVHETIFEVDIELDDEYDTYMDEDAQQRKLYEQYYGKDFVNLLHERDAFMEEEYLSKQRDKSSIRKDIPDLNEYKPFEFHWRRAQYVKWYGLKFIRKLHDKSARFDGELWAKKQERLNEKNAPDLDKYGPFRFHKQREKSAEDFKRDLVHFRRIKNLAPKDWKRFYSDATKESKDKDEHKDEYKGSR